MKVYGSRISYFTGKLETYLRYKRIAYTSLPTPYGEADMLKDKVGAVQMPIVERDDGRWMSDTTPMLLHLESEYPDKPIMPAAAAVGYIARLIEDYADEWLWRPAMHYRWSYRYDRLLASNILVDEVTGHLKLPRWLKRRLVQRRQTRHFVQRDGVTDETRAHVEQGYLNALDNMSAMLRGRRYLLGNAPSLADFGMMGPMFRHFGQDPTPQEIMRNQAPAVFAWVARMWMADRPDRPDFLSDIPEDARPMLQEICETHLEQLVANATASAKGQNLFHMTIQGCEYQNISVSRYRVWCLEQLRRRFAALPDDAKSAVRASLPFGQAEILWADQIAAKSAFNCDDHLPFGKAINVFRDGTP